MVVRPWNFRRGVQEGDLRAILPGKDFIPCVTVTATRAITVGVSPVAVRPWIAQLDQENGGLHSRDWLESPAGCDIHIAEETAPLWQHPWVGDVCSLAPDVALRIAQIDPG